MKKIYYATFSPCRSLKEGEYFQHEPWSATLQSIGQLNHSFMFKFLGKKKEEPENSEELLNEFKRISATLNNLSVDLEEFKKKSQGFIQKVGIVRFNPFAEVGSNQSFSIALLDGNNNGVVITSLYGREENRVYAKPIANGQSSYLLSEEEKRAISEAINPPVSG